jgi:hypothetical protein
MKRLKFHFIILESVDLAKIRAIGDEYFPLDHTAASEFSSCQTTIIRPRLLRLVIIEVFSVANFHHLVSKFNPHIIPQHVMLSHFV